MFCVTGQDYLITYCIDFETGYVFMRPAEVSSIVHDLYSILSITQINLIKSLIDDDSYTLDEVLNIDENQIEDIYCFYVRNLWDSIAYYMRLDIKETMKALDVEYYKLDTIGMDALNNKPKFSIIVGEDAIAINWHNDNTVYFEIDGKYYFSKKEINLYNYITDTRLHSLSIINPMWYSNIMNGYREKYPINLLSYNTSIMGIYDDVVVMFIEEDTEMVKTISILNYDFTYSSGFDILVYKDNNFYSTSDKEELAELLENKILVKEDIKSLLNRFNEYYK